MVLKVLGDAVIRAAKTVTGRIINVKYATRTETWTRPFLSPEIQEEVVKAIETADVPENAVTAIMA